VKAYGGLFQTNVSFPMCRVVYVSFHISHKNYSNAPVHVLQLTS